MEKEREAALLALASDPANLSVTAQIRALYPTILKAKKSGVSNKKLVAALNAQGVEMDLRAFVNVLYRLKKEGVIEPPAQTKAAALFSDFAKPATFKRTERP